MYPHRFKIGQIVEYRSDNEARPPAGAFMVLRLLPPRGSDQQYRIRSTSEPHERVALESQLTLPA